MQGQTADSPAGSCSRYEEGMVQSWCELSRPKNNTGAGHISDGLKKHALKA